MTDPQDNYRKIVRDAFRLALHIRRRDTFEQLADDFNLSPKTVTWLKNGRWSPTQRMLAEVLIDACSEWHTVSDAQPTTDTP
jgi:transcriptional regulator with XRE-family HTH domain